MKLGIVIPYYKNNEVCEKNFKLLMNCISKQLTDDMILFIYEDGQFSEWIMEYVNSSNNIIHLYSMVNKGVSYARNRGIDFLIDKVDYILFIDSDDMIDSYYLIKMYSSLDKKYDIIESRFFINDRIKEYEARSIRTGSCGMAIKSSFIGYIRFDENLLIGEDTKFMIDIMYDSNYIKKLVYTNYYYNLGDNVKSLWMRYKRNEIEKNKIMEGNNG